MEEDDYFWPSFEFPNKLREDDWYHVSHFVEENTNSADFAHVSTAKVGGEFYLSRGDSGQELGRLEAICAFGGPLVFFAIAPEDEDSRENCCKH